MSDIAIKTENFGKRYEIGEQLTPYKTLRDTLANFMKSPAKSFAKRKKEHIWALKDINLEIRRGEVIGIIGRNGAGKTTLLRILSKITEPTEGRAVIKGRVGSLLEVGTGFHPELTGRENIYLNGAILGMKKREINKKFDEIVNFADIEKFIDTPVKFYSSGMYVRLAFAIAAHLEPEILLIDEVLAVGDIEFQKRCLGKMENVAKVGRTVLYVSHNMPSVINLCHRAVLLDRGRVISDGRPNEVVQHYLATIRSVEGEAIWEDFTKAPGNDVVRLHAVRILQDGVDGPTQDVVISKDVFIQMEYWNLKEGAFLYSSIWLKDQMGTTVFASSNVTSISLTKDPWYERPRPCGLFQTVCCIPANLLNEGLYSVTAIVGKGAADTQVFEDCAVSFHAHDIGQMRKEYFGSWIGLVRPRLAWTTKYIGSQTGVSNNGVRGLK